MTWGFRGNQFMKFSRPTSSWAEGSLNIRASSAGAISPRHWCHSIQSTLMVHGVYGGSCKKILPSCCYRRNAFHLRASPRCHQIGCEFLIPSKGNLCLLIQTQSQSILAPQYYLLSFLPLSHPQSYLPMLFRLWESINSYMFDDRMLHVLSK